MGNKRPNWFAYHLQGVPLHWIASVAGPFGGNRYVVEYGDPSNVGNHPSAWVRQVEIKADWPLPDAELP